MIKKVGDFTLNTETSQLEAPAEYMKDRGNELLDRILGGYDIIFNNSQQFSPDVETAILVRLQTDYAGWVGQRLMTWKSLQSQ